MQKINDEKIEESLQKNQSPKSQVPKATPSNTQELLNDEEKLHTTKLKEDCQDAEYSLDNAKKLNKIYSQLMNIFFGGYWFYIWLLILFALFVISDSDFIKIDIFNKFPEAIIFIAKKAFYALGGIFVILLSFPTAKGIRKLFRSIVDILKHKVNN